MRFYQYSLIFLLSGSLLYACGDTSFPKGKKYYKVYCESCHMADGSGLSALIPPLAKSDYYNENLDKIACIIVNGLTDTIEVNGRNYSQQMEGIKLSAIQITNIINYINTSWGNDLPIKKLEKVKMELDNCDS